MRSSILNVHLNETFNVNLNSNVTVTLNFTFNATLNVHFGPALVEQPHAMLSNRRSTKHDDDMDEEKSASDGLFFRVKHVEKNPMGKCQLSIRKPQVAAVQLQLPYYKNATLWQTQSSRSGKSPSLSAVNQWFHQLRFQPATSRGFIQGPVVKS